MIMLVAIGFQVFGMASRRKHLVAMDAADLLPKALPGWTVEDRPIAESPDMLKTVEGVLNYDSAVFRIYKKGGVQIAVYLAYWLPGKIDPELVDAHTPDICWVDNGWQKTDLPSLPVQTIGGVSVAIPNHRRFTITGQDLTVLFWQISGHRIRHSESISEARTSAGRLIIRRIQRVWEAITTPPGQQLFLRISCNHSIEENLDSSPIHAGLELLSRSLSGENFYTFKK